MKKVRNLIILCITFVIITIIMIIVLKKQEDNPEIYLKDKESMGVGEFSNDILEMVSLAEGLQIRQVINQYMDVINKNNSAYFGRDENDNYAKVIDEDVIKNNIYNLLSEKYIEENNITQDNVYDYVEDITQKQVFTTLEIKKTTNENSTQYITRGFTEENNKFTGEKVFIVNFNPKEIAYSIEPINEENVDITKIQAKDVTITKNENNKIPAVLASNENVAKDYFTNFKRIILSYPEEAYHRLDKEYREKRFGEREDFEKFVTKNKEEIAKLTLTKYQINNKQDYIQYALVDQYNNIYTLEAKDFTDYTVKLDTYTIISDTFKTNYDPAESRKRVMMNIDKWIQMLNNRDYVGAYKVLDETFRNNNYKSQEEFENTIRNKCPLHYEIEFGEFSEENNTYVQEIQLKDVTGKEKGNIAITIIMQLKNNYEFVMSFEIEE